MIPERLTWSWIVGQLPKSSDRPEGYLHDNDWGYLLNPANGVCSNGVEVRTKPNVWALYLAARDLYDLAFARDSNDGAQAFAKALQQPAWAVLRAVGAHLGDPWAQPPQQAPSSPSLAALQGPSGDGLQAIADDAERLAQALEDSAKALRNWGALDQAARDRIRAMLPSLATEAVEAAQRQVQPLPLTDVCICRTCGKILLPQSCWGTPSYLCCSRFWWPDPRAGYGALRSDFWSHHKPGDRYDVAKLAPELDAKGRPTLIPNA